EICGYDLIIATGEQLTLLGSTDAAVKSEVANALVNKGVTRGDMNRSEEAIRVYDEVVQRYGEAPEVALREGVAKVLVNKGFRLLALNRREEAIRVYGEVVGRYGDATEAALQEQVAKAELGKV